MCCAGCCSLRSSFSLGRDALLWSCGFSPYRSGLTMDLQSGQPGALPEIGARASVVGGDSSVYVAVGTRWARGSSTATARRSRSTSTGRLVRCVRFRLADATSCPTSTHPASWFGSAPASDGPSWTTLRACSPRLARLSARDPSRRPRRCQTGAMDRRACSFSVAAAPRERCDRCLRIVCSDPVIVRGWIVWSETVYGYRARGRLVAYDSASRRMIRSAVRPAALIPVAVGRRLYVQQGQQVFRVGLGPPRGRVG